MDRVTGSEKHPYVSGRCHHAGQHNMCRVGPFDEAGGEQRLRGAPYFCTCKCHFVSQKMRIMFDELRMDNVQIAHYLHSLANR